MATKARRLLFALITWSAMLPAQETKPPEPDAAPVRTSITVTERIQTDAPASISVLNAADIQEVPGVNLDDHLRQVPGFSLFRRSSSLVANPTTQGISLRGIGSSGASRTLVLWDGVPMNDPFGGWIYWTRFPIQEIERVEISRGASTSLFGDRAMSGAITLFSSEPKPHHVWGSYEGGNRDTHELSAGGSNLWRRFAVSGAIRAFTTDGYYIVPESIRGPVDTMAGVRFLAGNVRLDYIQGPSRFFAKLDIVAEDRANGTVLQTNSTSLGTLSSNYSWQSHNDGISIVGYHTREQFHAAFSSVAAGRRTETLTYRQTVPSQATGAAAFWSHTSGRFNTLVGADVEHDQGASTDRLNGNTLRFGGGSRIEHGLFGQANVTFGALRLFAGARHTFTGGNETFFSPSGGFALGRGRWRARGSVYRSFRAPTLNELYREFRVGNTDTLPNAALKSETLFGAEAGIDFVGENTRAGFTLFRNSLDQLITNVTLSTGANIIRQRQNASAALSRGLEMNVQQKWRSFKGELAYLYAESRYQIGPFVPQVPRHQGSAELSYFKKGTLASISLRTTSLQFDDDLNQFRLPGYATLQLVASQRIVRGLSANLGFENLLDHRFLTALTPTPTIGAPRLWRAGLRWSWL